MYFNVDSLETLAWLNSTVSVSGLAKRQGHYYPTVPSTPSLLAPPLLPSHFSFTSSPSCCSFSVSSYISSLPSSFPPSLEYLCRYVSTQWKISLLSPTRLSRTCYFGVTKSFFFSCSSFSFSPSCSTLSLSFPFIELFSLILSSSNGFVYLRFFLIYYCIFSFISSYNLLISFSFSHFSFLNFSPLLLLFLFNSSVLIFASSLPICSFSSRIPYYHFVFPLYVLISSFLSFDPFSSPHPTQILVLWPLNDTI